MAENDLIWHFTGPQALFPILRDDGGLLATHQAFMNDASDCNLCRCVNRSLASILDHSIGVPEDQLPGEFIEVKSGLRAGTLNSMFLACFSAAFDNPLLWRCYTSQGGFAIGVSKTELRDNLDIFRKPFGDVHFKKCSYDRWDEVNHSVKSWRSTVDTRVKRLTRPDCTAEEKASIYMDSISEAFRLDIDLAFVKHPFFEKEEEFRILCYLHKPVPISELVVLDGKPRVKVPLLRSFSSLVRRILVSPFGDKEANYQLAQLLAASIGLPLKSVKLFDVPVR